MSKRRERRGGVGKTNQHPSQRGLDGTTRVLSSRGSSRGSFKSASRSSSRPPSRGSLASRGSIASRGSLASRGSSVMSQRSQMENMGMPPNIPQPQMHTKNQPRGGNGANGMPGGGRPPRSPRIRGAPGEIVHVKDRVLRNILKTSTASEYVRPAGIYMNKNQERFEITLEEKMHDLNNLHDNLANDFEKRGEGNDDVKISKQIDARSTRVKNFLDMSKKLAIPKAYYDPRFSKMNDEDIVDEIVASRNYGARMRTLRMKRARIMLNSSEGVQSCVSPRDGYASQGNADQFWTTKVKEKHKSELMKMAKKSEEDKVNHMVRNPTTYHINHMIRNKCDHRTMWRHHNWTDTDGYGHHTGSSGHHGAPKVSSKHWTTPYKPAS